jgi:hypothetical protein
MDGGVREVLKAAGMVEVEMGQDDVADVAVVEAERLDLAVRGLLLAQPNVEHRSHRAGDPRRMTVGVIDVAQAVTRVDQHQPVRIGLDQQAMADEAPGQPDTAPVEQGAAERAIGAAIEMMDAHRDPFPSVNERKGSRFRRLTQVRHFRGGRGRATRPG